MIFLSHTNSDKPVVEPIALQLRAIFGEDQVFYDAWSIRPGDGIIDKMNKGLTSPTHVFWFISENSLNSDMVKLEWQNALMKATKGLTKLIPIKVSDCDIPAIMLQTVYIDLSTNGIDGTVRQIVELLQGIGGFTPKHDTFSNLTWTVSGDPANKLSIVVAASHLTETQLTFAFVLDNNIGDATVSIQSASMHMGFEPRMHTFSPGVEKLVLQIGAVGGAIKPKFPMTFNITAADGIKLKLESVQHIADSAGRFAPLPQAAPPPPLFFGTARWAAPKAV